MGSGLGRRSRGAGRVASTQGHAAAHARSGAMTTAIVPAVAGMQIRHEPLPGTTLRTLYRPHWTGSVASEPPIVIRHCVGPLELAGMREVCDARPFCVYYSAPESPVAVRFPDMDGHAPAQLLVTVRPG